jgi:hypothetical protein
MLTNTYFTQMQTQTMQIRLFAIDILAKRQCHSCHAAEDKGLAEKDDFRAITAKNAD